MKGLTLTQPWAQLVALGAKQIETRSWRTDYRGPVAIHAAYGLGPHKKYSVYRACCEQPMFAEALRRGGYTGAAPLPLGAIVAVAELVACIEMVEEVEHSAFYGWVSERGVWELTDQERAFGGYAPGRYAWLLADVRRLRKSVPCRGALGLWTAPADVQAAIDTELRRAA